MSLRFDGRVAIVSGADLGRAHALGLAACGAKVVVNDLAATDQIRDPEGATEMADALAQPRKYARMAAQALGLPLPWTD